MSHEKIIIGQFLGARRKNPDTPDDPYDPTRESLLEDKRMLPNPDLVRSVPGLLPPIPDVGVSTPSALPAPPKVTLGSMARLPPPLPVVLSSPAGLPPIPKVQLSTPGGLPAAPPVTLSTPAKLPPIPGVVSSQPSPLPQPPGVVLSQPSKLPPAPQPQLSIPGKLPPSPEHKASRQAELPDAPAVELSQPRPLAIPMGPDPQPSRPAEESPTFVPAVDSGYSVFGEKYSPGGAGDPGSLSADPVMYERRLEREARLSPGKVLVHSAIQETLFSRNNNGKLWNPIMLAHPPLPIGSVLPGTPAFDTVPHKETIDAENVAFQATGPQLADMNTRALSQVNYNSALRPVKGEEGEAYELFSMRDIIAPMLSASAKSNEMFMAQAPKGSHQSLSTLKKGASSPFSNKTLSLFNQYGSLSTKGKDPSVVTSNPSSEDSLSKTAFSDGIIPMKLKGDNRFGFRTFKSNTGDQTDDDDVYVPLCFTDLRPVNNTYRAVYFRPIITNLGESFSPEWNKSGYLGRVDPVATYQSTGRSISLGFKLVAFGPEDVRTIYQKLHWLSSMVYPEYDSNMSYKSGPVVRMRVGDVINAAGAGRGNGKGLPGIIESLEYDYSDSLWELEKDFKVPRNIDVSLSFTVLHDMPVGRLAEGLFGGVGEFDENGVYRLTENSSKASDRIFRKFGKDKENTYESFAEVDKE